MDLKRALAAYVSGRNGGWDSELKSEPSHSSPVAETDPSVFASVPHTGVPVPLRLGFERGPGMWRSRLQDASRG